MKSTEWTLDIFKSLFEENKNVKFDKTLSTKGYYFWRFDFGDNYTIDIEYNLKHNNVVIYVDTALNADTMYNFGSSNSGVFKVKFYTDDFYFKFKEMVSELNRIKESWNKINKLFK